MKTLILFDVCGTIVEVNSTYDYINFLIKKGIKRYYKPFFINRFIWVIYVVLGKFFGKDIKRDLAIWYMKGLNISDLKEINKQYFVSYKQTLRQNIFNKLLEEKSLQDVYIISASINPPIDLLKSIYKIHGFSSLLEEKKGFYTGKLTLDLLGKKQMVFEKKMIDVDNYECIAFYTDNEEDISLIDYLCEHQKRLKIYIILKNNQNYWNSYFKNKQIEYEFIY